jgi:autotransporter-associated beta strand protein
MKAGIKISPLAVEFGITSTEPRRTRASAIQSGVGRPWWMRWAPALAAAGGLLVSSAHAAIRTWDGGGTNNNWTTATNWVGDVAPTAGDDLLFPPGAPRLSPNNDFPAGTTFNSIAFSGADYTLDGNLIALNAGIVATNGVNNWILNPLTLNSNQTFTIKVGSGGFTLPAAIDLNGKDLTFDVTSPSIAQVQALISGAGGLIKTGNGTLSLYTSNTFAGPVQILQGFLSAYDGHVLGDTNGDTTVAAGAMLTLVNQLVVPEPLVLAGTLNSAGGGTKTLDGPVLLTAPNATIQTSVGAPLTINGVISGTGGFSKTSTDTLTLNANNTYLGTTTLSGGTLRVNGSQPDSPMVLSLGTLAGTGTVGTITVSGFLGSGVAPGASPGILASSNVTFNGGTALAVELDGPAPGSGYDQLSVTGTVALGNASLGVSLGFDPPAGTAFTIINNDGVDAVGGAFNGLPEGANLSANGRPLQITYGGGSGNDVVLTRISPPATFTSVTNLGNGQVQLQATGGLPAFTYYIEAATDLHSVIQWSNIGWAVPDSGGVFSFVDTNAPVFPARFYRALAP